DRPVEERRGPRRQPGGRLSRRADDGKPTGAGPWACFICGRVVMREWVLAEQTHAAVRAQPWGVAVLPVGATEPHNLHMPYGTDNFQVGAVAERACERAYGSGARVILLPTVPYGVNTNYLRVPGALACSVTPTTLLHLLTDLVDSLERQGVHKVVLLNGH